MMLSFLILLALVILAIAIIAIRMMKRRKLSPALRQQLQREWGVVMQHSDAHRKILDADKVLDHALGALGFQGSMADKLRVAGPRFSRVQTVWEAHKLRNRIAHEVGVQLSVQEVNSAMHAFERALKDLGM
jgi:hypothetical protein